jgi:hypothetical protein
LGGAKIKLRLPDGRVIAATAIKGPVLIAIPSKYARTAHEGTYIVAFDHHGREMLRGRPED